ncbi:MAG: amino acid adenylation domain-containing protein [Geminicoccaceae bacterium]
MPVSVDLAEIDRSVFSLIRAAMDGHAQADAVIAADARLTYQQLDAHSAQRAAELQAAGVGRGTLVGLCLERSCQLVVSLLAVMRLGAIYVPLDPDFPAARLAHMVADSDLSIVIAEHATLGALDGIEATVVCLEDLPLVTAGPLADSDTPGGDLCYVMYTSGSTGLPKGVAVEHRQVVNFLKSMAQEPGMAAGDRLLAVTTLSFDIAGLELLLPLTVGGTVVVAGRADVVDGARLAELIADHAITMMQATPTTWRLLLESGWRSPSGFKILCGGEAMPADLARQLCAGEAEVWNLYGPTETTIWSSCYRLPSGGTPILIGAPIANTAIYILDRAGRPTPPGVPGELHIGGAGVARGYLGKPELTDERFVPDPFTTQPGARMYRTGDLGRYLPDGLIALRGRSDSQIKLRGYRIELGEIEAVLTRLAEIEQSAVRLIEPRPGDARLIAHLVVKPGRDLAPESVREHARQHLPAYMVPQHYMTIDALPLTPNGKVDRHRLPAPETADWLEDAYVAPTTASERVVCDVFATILGLEQVSVTSGFFDLGGHSILATRVMIALRSTLCATLSLRDVFEAHHARDLAARIDALNDDTARSQAEAGYEELVI